MGASAEDFALRIRLRAGEYFAGLDRAETSVRLLRASATWNSRLFEFQVTDGLSYHKIVAKAPFSARRLRQVEDHRGAQVDRPRFFPLADTQLKGLHEFLALSAIYDHFTRLNDPRFGVIRPLDICGRPYCLIMEKAGDSSLLMACRKMNRTQSSFSGSTLASAMSNAGAWLRCFHQLPFLPHTENCNTGRSDVIAAIEMFTDYMEKQSLDGLFFKELRQKLVRAADDLLTNVLPLGLTHRDFAPRNILVGSQGRVTVFDTQGRWHSPVYTDLAHFLVALKVSWPQICSAGRYYNAGTLTACEQNFLRGYFGETPIPTDIIRLFECILLLEWWVELSHLHRRARGVRRAARFGQLHVCSRYVKQYVRGAVDQMDIGTGSPKS